eukprot:5590869-Amphidinium_carterae.1
MSFYYILPLVCGKTESCPSAKLGCEAGAATVIRNTCRHQEWPGGGRQTNNDGQDNTERKL